MNDKIFHKNSFGFLRLIFSIWVILSHIVEVRDGNRDHEILTWLFHSISFGELAVDGFFIVSGYLITKSFTQSNDIYAYFLKRASRIYPGYIVAFLIFMLFFGYIGGGHYPDLFFQTLKKCYRILFLQKPKIKHIFSTVSYNNGTTNAAMWTLFYEAKCYILIVFLSMLGILKKYRLIILIIFLMVLYAFIPMQKDIRLFLMFLSGASMYVYRAYIPLSKRGMAAAFLCMILSLCCGKYAEIGVAIFGAYTFISFAILNNDGFSVNINNKNDFSYGIYLYAWPIESALLYYIPKIGYIELFTFDLAGAFSCAVISWFFVEKPVLNYVHKFLKRRIADSKEKVNIPVPEIAK